ncbi:SGNH/GDSL hydrolase family protein [Candidatus Poribacteria bacterium]|jgi:acyl-CoA thioesterase I|nr:SGNH/GDSL hydrolase family protein [Candidatus Poribacteria bacterium]MBT5535887.1 SGNH/GDSL hydrolase family protein [Candidatus Poribacteria bacterium]MBT5715225.1 SGNH/GDSL hydrolase family protein [Candidatus Poribacteria bacterium]MBT7099652.1 SGNH/GDSL hydrolase family protein [Candidatus Poribacteria bacterium]MBT7805224.1 SGNH/GDSL hydrolase family protein [Candidatus Poribacteria bacterium]
MNAPGKLLLQDGESVLFIGDSITDAGRQADTLRSLGAGYVAHIADLLAARYPDRRIGINNQGISGNRVVDLRARWDRDVVAHQPDWVSISIGVNDVWRWFDGNPDAHIPIDEYRSVYHELLVATVEKTDARLILMETSVIGEEADNESNAMLAHYNEAIREYAREHDAVLVPTFRRLLEAIEARPGFEWTGDGVHPLPPGHMLMAVTWLEAMGATAP